MRTFAIGAATVTGSVVAVLLTGLGVTWPPAIIVGICTAVLACISEWPRSRSLPITTEVPESVEKASERLGEDADWLRDVSESTVAELTKKAKGFASIAEAINTPYDERFEEATSYIEGFATMVANFIADSIARYPGLGTDEEFRRRTLALDVPEAFTQEELGALEKFQEVLSQGHLAYAKELWKGSIRVARVQCGSDAVDAVFAERQARLS